jgi:CheY-like chemotaxis protein/anti-sigma regulatory factor (Ser/Thr protein kinase)
LKDKDVQLSVEPSAGVHVPHDPPRLAQAVLNVLSNAVDAAASGGGHVAMRVRVLDTNVVIEVDDDGPGISPDLARTAFEPFTTTKPFGHGTGLGLAITRQIVMDHRGDVTLEPRPEGGARVALSLPRFTPGVYKLLVLDDDPAVRRALATDLRREGFDVVSSGSFAEAKQALHEQQIQVIITDWHLPDIGGTELLSVISAESPTSRLIVMSADPATLPRDDVDDAIGKPWDRQKMIQIVRELCLKGERNPHQIRPAR